MLMDKYFFFFRFIACGLLLSVLLLVSSMEFIQCKIHKYKITKTQESDFRKACTWAIVGLIISILASLFSQAAFIVVVEGYIYFVIGSCLCTWIFYYVKASMAIDHESVIAEYNEQLSDQVLKYVIENHNASKTIRPREVWKAVRDDQEYPTIDISIIQELLRLSKKAKPVSEVISLLEPLACSEPKIILILEKLSADGKIQGNSENGFYL